jgi:glycosyltransferase involved in cell wall biosynthesis
MITALSSDFLQQRARSAAAAANVPCPYPASLSLCLPAFNEEGAIGTVLFSARAILDALFDDFEIVVVDDGSTDRTAEVVLAEVRADKRVRMLRHAQNRGYGSAVTSGLRNARGDLVMFMDSDGQFNLLDLPQFLVHIDRCDWIAGFRQRRAESGLRRLNAWCWSTLVALVLNVSIRDLDCAFKLFHRRVIDSLDLSSTGACINAEILSQCVRNGMRLREVPVSHVPRLHGQQTGASPRVILRAFRELPALMQYRCSRTKVNRYRPLDTT